MDTNGGFSISFAYWRMNFHELVVSLVSLTLEYGMVSHLHPLPGWNCRVSKIDAKRVWAFFFSARWFCSSVGVQCNTVQSLCDFMGNIGRFGNSQDCVDACPRLNWFKNVKNNFCGRTNQPTIQPINQPTNQSINQSIGPNFPRGQHATVAGDGNFDTVQTALILVHWKLTTKLNVESYFWTWDFHLQYTWNILQSPMKPENIRFESIWSI